MADSVGTRERRVLASFRRSDPPQEGVHVDVGGQWTVFNKDRDRLRGGLDPTVESIGVIDQHYPKHRRMSTQRNRAGRQLPERNRLIGRYPGRDFTMRDIGISIPPPRQSPSRRIPELAETEQHRLIRWRSTNLCEAGHPFTRLPTRGAHMDPLLGHKCCTNSRTLVQEYLTRGAQPRHRILLPRLGLSWRLSVRMNEWTHRNSSR